MQGAPKEKESDRCLAEIVRNKLNSNDRIPGLCAEILTDRKSSRGYPLTHRLLIVLIAKMVSVIDIFSSSFFFRVLIKFFLFSFQLKCDRDLPSSDLILSYCSAILRDLIDIKTAGFPDQTPDLMMEQGKIWDIANFVLFFHVPGFNKHFPFILEVVLCGMQGFLEFTDKYYERLVLSWSHSSGCLSSFGYVRSSCYSF